MGASMGTVLGQGDYDSLVPRLPGAPGEAVSMMYEVGATLGKGTSGRVCLALERETGQMVALKIVPKATLQTSFKERYGRGLVKEILGLRHANVVRVRALAEDSASTYVAMELCRGPELFEVLKRSPLATAEASKIILQLLSAIGYLHSRGLVHRDVKPENFMFADRNLATLKLIDMGSLVFQSEERSTEVIGSVGFCAPEVFKGGCCIASDVFSAGVIVALALTGVWPQCLRPDVWMPSNGGSSTRRAVGSYRAAVLEMTPEEVRSWVSKALCRRQYFKGPLAAMLDPRPERRPEASAARWLFADAADTELALAEAASNSWRRKRLIGGLTAWVCGRAANCASGLGACCAGLRRPRRRRRRQQRAAPADSMNGNLDGLRVPRGSLMLPGATRAATPRAATPHTSPVSHRSA